MIERYSLEPMKGVWTLKAQYERWLEVELAVLQARERLGQIPFGTHDLAVKSALIDIDRIAKIESVVDHDVIAFIQSITEENPDLKRHFHFGLTSSDVVDTANALALSRAGQIILKSLDQLLNSLWHLADKHRYTPMIGRTHGVHAQQITFGIKALHWYAEMKRNRQRLFNALEQIRYGKISGAVGNYPILGPEVEEEALRILGLKTEAISNQIVPRDRHAELLVAFGIIGSGIERFAQEIRHLHRTEVGEVCEPFKPGQKGSSAMPHKKNPILCERLCGLARILRSYTIAAMENIPLWHERDISHSSVERILFPEATSILHYMLHKSVHLIDHLVVQPQKMLENMQRSMGVIFSQRLTHCLLEKGVPDAYDKVQSLAFTCEKEGVAFKTMANDSPVIRRSFSDHEWEAIFSDPEMDQRIVDLVFNRVRKNSE